MWHTRPGSFFKPFGLLMYNSVKIHLFDSVKSACRKSSVTIVIIPVGLTKKLHSYMKGRNMRKVSVSEVAKWVVDSWKKVKIFLIKSWFAEAGIIGKNIDVNENSNDSDSDDS